MDITISLTDAHVRAFRRQIGIPADLAIDATITQMVTDRVVNQIGTAVLQPAINQMVNESVSETVRSLQSLSDADRQDVQQQLAKIVADKQAGSAVAASVDLK